MKKILVFIFVSLFLICFQNKVIKITSDNYQKTVLDSQRQWVIYFTAPSCQQCESFVPIWNNLKNRIEHSELGEVNIDESMGNLLAQQLGVTRDSIPNVKYIVDETHIYSILTAQENASESEIMKRLTVLRMKAQKGMIGKKKRNKRVKDDL
ncbi:MAG: thioredoxin domain-containing protein [archaeon]|nr:thioredoxin domain-containing protein [archaeon]